jgi:uncharacterized RDD family membrane protein YckC
MEMALHCRNHWDVLEGLRSCGRCGQTYCRDCLVDINGLPYCATCKNETLLDVRSGVVIGPTALNLASPLRRLGAFILDSLILGIPYAVIIGFTVFSHLSGGQLRPETMVLVQLLNLSIIVVFFVYEGFMLAARGQTLGKMAVGIKVVRPDGSDISTGQAWGRAAMRQVLVSCLCLINYLPILFTQEKTALHDMVASTRVVNWN